VIWFLWNKFNTWIWFCAFWYEIKCYSDIKSHLKAIDLRLFQENHSINIKISYKNSLDFSLYRKWSCNGVAEEFKNEDFFNKRTSFVKRRKPLNFQQSLKLLFIKLTEFFFQKLCDIWANMLLYKVRPKSQPFPKCWSL